MRLAQRCPQRVFYAAAHRPSDEKLVGRAIYFLDGDLAGIFDLAVWPEKQQRQGYGTGLMAAVSAAAAAAGARQAVLNATPDGEKLYPTLGYRTLGRGRTWWLHLKP